MTRINSAIPVRSLTDEHLLAEHREIKRLPYCLERAIASGSIHRIPVEFTLGRGHVLFFLDKMKFVFNRYQNIHEECLLRSFFVADYSDNFSNIPPEYYNDYTPTQKEMRLLRNRISERLTTSPKKSWHYYGQIVDVNEALRHLD